jgi:hypothetical protein
MFAKIFQYLSSPEEFSRRPYSESISQDEVGVDCLLYSYGIKNQWPEISKAAGDRMRRHWPGIKNTSVFDNALLDAREADDRPMYSFFMEKRGFPRHILPTPIVPSAYMDHSEPPGSARTVIEEEPSDNLFLTSSPSPDIRVLPPVTLQNTSLLQKCEDLSCNVLHSPSPQRTFAIPFASSDCSDFSLNRRRLW